MIEDRLLLEDCMTNTNPSLSSICVHAIIDVGKGMCKEFVLTESGNHQNTKNNQKQHLHYPFTVILNGNIIIGII